ncbi:MAG: short-chain dehydrogenase/reductase [Gemmatimonadetes bacterium]|nr:short-chain dehydrogenase/reductase [Gemmatimonadota bacterium]
MSKLKGKVALVTGAGRGIGQAIAVKLASEGARVVINDMDDAPANETAALVRAAGGEAALCVGSVTDAGFGDRFVKVALDEFQGLDIIVNNAGFTWDSVIQKMTDEQFAAVLDVHVTAPFRILRAAAEPIRALAKEEAAAGREVFRKVVNISSVSGLGGNPGQVNYAAGKAAVVGMTKTLAKEWGRYKVNVNCVAFGFIRTRMTQALSADNAPVAVAGREIKYGVQPALIEALETQQIPLGRMGTAEEAADGVYLFCSPESNYISGQVITVGGGITF